MNRREFLRLTGGVAGLFGYLRLFGLGGLLGLPQLAHAQSATTLHTRKGAVALNGGPADAGIDLAAGDRLSTGANSAAIVIAAEDALWLRGNAALEFQGEDMAVKLERGALLFSLAKDRSILTPAGRFDVGAGAGLIAVQDDGTYFCLCYGDAVLSPAAVAERRDAFLSEHHDRPVFVRHAPGEDYLASASVIGHTDEEIAELEALVGRKPPFAGD